MSIVISELPPAYYEVSILSNRLTIVLTIKGRPEFTQRWMHYMNTNQCSYKILIADGGNDRFIQDHLKNRQNYPHLDYDYIRYPYDGSLGIYYKKICDVTDKVSTPYLLYADNDDFIILDKIDEYLDFLDRNSNYVCCGGASATLSMYSNNNEIIGACYGSDFDIRFDKLQPFSVEHSSGVKRVCDFFRHAESDRLWFIWYDIQRTSQVKISHEFIRRYAFKDVVALEIFKITSLLMLGKSKRFDSLFYIRQQGASESSSAIDAEANVIERFIDINAYREIVDGLMYVNDSMSDSDRRAINQSFAYWLSEKVKIIYFPYRSKIWILLKKIYFISNSFRVAGFVARKLYSLRNLVSLRKVYFLRIKSIEEVIALGNRKCSM